MAMNDIDLIEKHFNEFEILFRSNKYSIRIIQSLLKINYREFTVLREYFLSKKLDEHSVNWETEAIKMAEEIRDNKNNTCESKLNKHLSLIALYRYKQNKHEPFN